MSRRSSLSLLSLSLAASAPAQDVVLNEFLALNTGGLLDESGTPEPWIELHNRGAVDADVGGLVLTRTTFAQGWALPEGTTIAAGGQLVVFADAEPTQGPLHATFALGEFAGDLRLLSTDGTSTLDAVAHPDQKSGVATGRLRDGGTRWVSLLDPTPGASNEPLPGEHRRIDAFDPYLHVLSHSVVGEALPGGALVFTVADAPADLTVLWYLSPTTLDFEFPSGQSVLLVGLEFPAIPLPLDAQGAITYAVHVPNSPVFAGLTIYTQGFVLQQYFKGSNALEIVLGD